MDSSQWHCLLPKTSTLAPCVAKERATSEHLAHTCSYYLIASFHLYRWVKCCVRGVSLDSMILFSFLKLLTVAIGSIRNYWILPRLQIETAIHRDPTCLDKMEMEHLDSRIDFTWICTLLLKVCEGKKKNLVIQSHLLFLCANWALWTVLKAALR